jgi:hypothetical protein
MPLLKPERSGIYFLQSICLSGEHVQRVVVFPFFRYELRKRHIAAAKVITLWRWAQYERKHGNKKEGEAMWQEARDIFTRLKLPLMIVGMETR